MNLQYNYFFDSFSDKDKISILFALAQAMRQIDFSPIRFSSLITIIVRGAVNHVVRSSVTTFFMILV